MSSRPFANKPGFEVAGQLRAMLTIRPPHPHFNQKRCFPADIQSPVLFQKQEIRVVRVVSPSGLVAKRQVSYGSCGFHR
jgi:hypothetical protein